MTELAVRRRASAPTRRSRDSDLWWLAAAVGASALLVGFLVTVSLQAAFALVLLVAVVALYVHDRRYGIAALFALWFIAPGLRRVLGAAVGFAENDPLSIAPFLATAAIAGIELSRARLPGHIQRVLLLAAAGFAIGLPVGLAAAPQAAVYAFGAYLAGVSGAVLGARERPLLEDSTLGILGLGRIGQRIAALAGAFGMTVIAWSENLTAEGAAAHGAERVSKHELFERGDIVSIHTLLSHRTRGLVGAADLELLGPGGYLVNTSRGPIVDEAALVAALQGGVIAGAALDVFDVEPLPAGHPLLSTPRTILSPHVGFVSRRAYEIGYGQALEDIVGWLDGDPVRVLNSSS